MDGLSPRYEALHRLGQGGGGEVWAVRDRVLGATCALKALAAGARDAELEALVREATALSGLEGLGVPRVLAFGALADGRRYLVRELVEGKSLAEVFDSPLGDWLEPLVHATDQLGALHRAGLFHGDVKPANIIVRPDRRGTLVDLGLASRWREASRPHGLTPRYAAPELLSGGPSVRAEVYAVAATLAEGLARHGAPADVRSALDAIARRGTETDPQRRFPSASELADAIRVAAKLAAAPPPQAWPVLGLDADAHALREAVRGLARGDGLAVVGPPGSGRSTLLRRLAWTLGVTGERVVLAETPRTGLSRRDALALAVDPAPDVVIVEDADALPEDARRMLTELGTRVVGEGSVAALRGCSRGEVHAWPVPPLARTVVDDLVRRAMPSLAPEVVDALESRTGGRPGPLREALRALSHRAVVSARDLEDVPAADAPTLDHVEELIDLGRVTDAEQELASLGPAPATRVAVARARIETHRGEPLRAIATLNVAPAPGDAAWTTALARALLRAGRFAEAAEHAANAPGSIEALVTRGVACAYLGDDAASVSLLDQALATARARGDVRGEGFALGSLGIAHQRAGRSVEARAAYEQALPLAERARDATTVVATRMNLAAIAREEGDLAKALGHLEATVDLGKRAGGLMAVEQARINLVNLDLYVGRVARARAVLDGFSSAHAGAAAQLLGCRAELAARTGALSDAARLYDACAAAYDALGRASDATEARLESLFVRAEAAKDVTALRAELERLPASSEHRALACMVRGLLAWRDGQEDEAKRALDEAVDEATRAHQHERLVGSLTLRARVLAAQGLALQSRRDHEAAAGLLEQTAARLPRDLREVFWDEPRRAALRAVVREPTQAAPRVEDKLARVLEIVREVATEHDLPRLLAKVTDHAIALLGAEHGFLVLGTAGGELEVHAARNRKGDDPHALFSRSVAARVIASGEPVVTLRAREDERLAEAVSVHELAIQSIACVPVRGAPPLGHPIGALYVETRARAARFQDEVPVLRAFADQAAIAIENARLLAENQARARELEVAHEKLEAALGRRTEQLADARRDLHRVRASLRSHFGYGGLVGTSEAMRRVYALIDRVKDTDIPVLVTGESGTGKEVVARAIHDAGPRARRTFTGINCGAIPPNLLESELFGHVRGAFTGADRDRKGVLRECDGGTLLLDEIGEMPLKMQASLLRTLQENKVRPLGAVREESVDVRIITATNRDLDRMVKEGLFREDLYYRLHVVEVRVPALRERPEDIPPLVDHFLTLFSTRYRRDKKTIHRDAVRRLCAYDWPGNVRQLEHVLLNAWLMGEADTVEADDVELPEHRILPRPPAKATNEAEFRDSEKDRILRALAACNWNRAKAAELTGIPRRTFYRRLKEFGIL